MAFPIFLSCEPLLKYKGLVLEVLGNCAEVYNWPTSPTVFAIAKENNPEIIYFF